VARFYTAGTMGGTTRTTGTTPTTGTAPTAKRPLSMVFVSIVALEVAAILGLYWAGVHFAS